MPKCRQILYTPLYFQSCANVYLSTDLVHDNKYDKNVLFDIYHMFIVRHEYYWKFINNFIIRFDIRLNLPSSYTFCPAKDTYLKHVLYQLYHKQQQIDCGFFVVE